MEGLRKFLENPWVHLFMGLVLVVSSGVEIWDDLSKDVFRIGAHHGVALFGLFHVLSSLPDIFDAGDHVQKAIEKSDSSGGSVLDETSAEIG